MCQLRKVRYKNVDPGALALCVRVKNVMWTRRVCWRRRHGFQCVCLRDRGAAADRRTRARTNLDAALREEAE